jgi:hypothetical protein
VFTNLPVGGELLFVHDSSGFPRLAAILRCAILSSFSSTFIYGSLFQRSPPKSRNHGVQAIAGPNGPKNDVEAVEAVTQMLESLRVISRGLEAQLAEHLRGPQTVSWDRILAQIIEKNEVARPGDSNSQPSAWKSLEYFHENLPELAQSSGKSASCDNF